MNSRIAKTIFVKPKSLQKRFLTAFCMLLAAMMLALSVFCVSIPDHRLLPRVVDDAGLLSNAELSTLTSTLDEMSERLQFDIAVVTVTSIGSKNMQDYADDFYDYNGYGIGDDADGMMLVVLINSDERECYITATGYGENVLTDRVLDDMLDEIVFYLKDGEYLDAFNAFAELAEDNLQITRDGEGFDPSWILYTAVIGILVSFIIVGGMKRKLKSVRKRLTADDYIRKDSLDVKESRELFLYSSISRTAIQSSSSSGGGNSTSHTSSSGRSHSGGGRSF